MRQACSTCTNLHPQRPQHPTPPTHTKTGLRELDLRDNQLAAAPDLHGFAALRLLDLSYNEVGD